MMKLDLYSYAKTQGKRTMVGNKTLRKVSRCTMYTLTLNMTLNTWF